MSKRVEKLLSVDPIGAFDKIKANYVRYFKTSYRFKETDDPRFVDYSYLNKQLYGTKDGEEGILQKNGNLYKEPYAELLPEYKSANCELKDLLLHNGGDWPAHFAELVSRGLMRPHGDKPFIPYAHQFEMLKLAYKEKKNVVITSGTGSGKTEAFMLPLMASLLKEAATWKTQNYDSDWYAKNNEGKYDQPYQRLNESRPAAIRALLLYPMNALVNDQMSRLRQALDNEDVRSFFDDPNYGYKKNRIFFGRYNGDTIGKQDLRNAGNFAKTDCLQKLDAIVSTSRGISRKLGDGLDPDAEYVAPRFPDATNLNHIGSEMLTRWDMQSFPPDILITNVSMLSIILMRSYEDNLFDQTRKYYENNKDAVFHLIVDELHLHRGTSGSEVACLLRMFLERIGVPPTIVEKGKVIANPRLRILASSASLGSTREDTERFLEEFFGVYNEDGTAAFTIIGGKSEIDLQDLGLHINYEDFAPFALEKDDNGLGYVDDGFKCRDAIIQRLLDKYKRTSLIDFLRDYHEQIYYDLHKLTVKTEFGTDGSSTTRSVPIPVSQIARGLGCSLDAVRGLFIFRGDSEVNSLSTTYKLPRIRFHQFFKYIEGLWGELQDPAQNNGRCIGQLSYQPVEVVKTAEGKVHRALELLRCECCGNLFIGGNRMTSTGQTTALLLNTPNLSSIPNRNATPMVQNKLYQDYAVFLPSTDDLNLANKYPYVDEEGKSRNGSMDKHAAWIRAWLNPFDGRVFENAIPGAIAGYLYRFEKETKTTRNGVQVVKRIGLPFTEVGKLSALPCQCPCCNKDYTKRRYMKSPIRSFRTGIKRSNQLLSKELIYQLSDAKQEAKQRNANAGEYYQPHGKLIGFSDSRQDAAEQSYGIAQEHFRDLVRYFFVNIINHHLEDGGIAGELSRAKSTLIYFIQTLHTPPTQLLSLINSIVTDPTIQAQLQSIVLRNDPDPVKINNINRISAPATDAIPLGGLISSNTDLDGEMVQELVRIGVNPSGVDFCNQNYGNNNLFWDQFYDCTINRLKPVNNRPTGYDPGRVSQLLESYIYDNCFGKYMGLNTEDAGLGYVVSKLAQSPDEKKAIMDLQQDLQRFNLNLDASDFLNAYLRVLGDNHRFNDPDFDAIHDWNFYDSARLWQQSFSSECRAPLKKLTNNDDSVLGNHLKRALDLLIGEHVKLDIKKLSFVLVKDDDPYYRCPKCGRVHLHRGMGICTNTACMEPLPDKPTGCVSELRKNNFISYDIVTEPRDACRIHTEELTGQTDDQTRRLLEFKDVILDEQIDGQTIAYSPKTKVIDMLNVTTTMEVGVDIGSLQAVFQGNMPPTRYNYQQRVGRGGRRGQAFSTAVTFCRGRSHDSYFYNYALDEITGGKPKDPTLSVNPVLNNNENIAIIKRVLLKHVLMYAFKEFRMLYPDNMVFAVEGDTHGQFGKTSDWAQTTRILLENWLGDNVDLIKKLSRYYLAQFNLAESDYQEKLTNWFRNDLLQQIDIAVSSSCVDGLAQTMAEAGLLPLYGMPTSVRKLIHGKDAKGNERVIDRPLEQAITDLAPGSVKTKDAGKYRSAGLTVPTIIALQDINEDPNVFTLQRPDLDPLNDHRYITYNDHHQVSSIDMEEDLNNASQRLLVIPKAFRTGSINYNKGQLADNSDSRSAFSQTEVFVKESDTILDRSFANVECKLWNCDDQEKSEVWHINDNNGNFFELVRAFKEHGNKTVDRPFYNGDITTSTDDYHEELLQFAPSYMDVRFEDTDWKNSEDNQWKWTKQDETVKIALGAKRVTDVLRLSIADCNSAINLNLKTGNVPAIKSAYYSAATLIQRFFADEIDIDPDELEISIQDVDGNPVAYLSDRLDNGAGFIKMLCEEGPSGKPHIFEIMSEIINPNSSNSFIKHLYSHKGSCKTACHNCLKIYNNQGIHHILDWRLGVDLIKLMLDKNYKMGINNLHETPYGDLESIMQDIATSVQDSRPGIVSYERLGEYFYFKEQVEGLPIEQVSYLIHPLWNESHLPRLDGNMMRAHDTFSLLRCVYTSSTQSDNLVHIERTHSQQNTFGIEADDDDLS